MGLLLVGPHVPADLLLSCWPFFWGFLEKCWSENVYCDRACISGHCQRYICHSLFTNTRDSASATAMLTVRRYVTWQTCQAWQTSRSFDECIVGFIYGVSSFYIRLELLKTKCLFVYFLFIFRRGDD